MLAGAVARAPLHRCTAAPLHRCTESDADFRMTEDVRAGELSGPITWRAAMARKTLQKSPAAVSNHRARRPYSYVTIAETARTAEAHQGPGDPPLQGVKELRLAALCVESAAFDSACRTDPTRGTGSTRRRQAPWAPRWVTKPKDSR
ncbi:hypothetical protein ADL00_34775 [Streptomyces sp. AS58]|nr:hypothetical protein ADL00_34775 [Streptomyces sp. AS58]